MKKKQPDNELIMARRIFGTIYDFAREAYRRGANETYKRFIDNIRFSGICFDCSKSDVGKKNEKEFHAFMKKCVASKVTELDPHFHDYEGGGEDRIMELFLVEEQRNKPAGLKVRINRFLIENPNKKPWFVSFYHTKEGKQIRHINLRFRE